MEIQPNNAEPYKGLAISFGIVKTATPPPPNSGGRQRQKGHAMTTKPEAGITVRICVDCLVYSEYKEGTTPEHASAYVQGLNNWIFSDFTKAYMYADSEECTAFSKSNCELCNSPLHGARYKGIIVLQY